MKKRIITVIIVLLMLFVTFQIGVSANTNITGHVYKIERKGIFRACIRPLEFYEVWYGNEYEFHPGGFSFKVKKEYTTKDGYYKISDTENRFYIVSLKENPDLRTCYPWFAEYWFFIVY